MLHNSPFGKSLFRGYLDKNENILFIAHKHGVLILGHAIAYVLLGVVLPMVLFATGDAWFWQILALLLAITSFLNFLHRFLLWYYDCWLVCDQGIIDIKWGSLLNRKNIRYTYGNFEGITTEIRGFWNTLLRLGTVTLIRQVDVHQIELVDASNPKRIEEKVLELKAQHAEEMKKSGNSKHGKVTELLSEMLAEYAEKRGVSLE